jgi:NAD(P)H dehydrogenase (quinone)
MKKKNVFIVYCHPSEESFTRNVRDSFIQGLEAAGHSYELSDLYAMDFQSDMSKEEYTRDAFYHDIPVIGEDVRQEQEKINRADIIVFIYPVFWTDVPAKMKGWFDRVLSYNFAYGNKTMKMLDKVLILCTAGNKIWHLKRFGLLRSMKKIMLGDRFFNRAKKKSFVVFDGMAMSFPEHREKHWEIFKKKAYEIGKNL